MNPGDAAGADKCVRRSVGFVLERAVILTSLTTAIGFLSFAISPIQPMRVFGLSAAAGVILCMLWSLTVLPAFLALLGNRIPTVGDARRGASLRERTGPTFAAWARLVGARRHAVLAGAAAFALLSAWGGSKVRIQDSWIEGFAPNSELRRHTKIVDELFGGTHLLRVRVATDNASATGRVARADFDDSTLLLTPAQLGPSIGIPPGAFVGQRLVLKPANAPGGVAAWRQELRVNDAREEAGGIRLFLASPMLPSTPIRDLLLPDVLEFDFETDTQGRLVEPQVLAHLRAFEEHLSGLRSLGAGAVLGPWSHLANLNSMIGADPDRAHAILSDRKGIDRTLQLYRGNRGERRMREVFSPDLRRGLVTVLLKNASYASVGELLSDLRSYESEHLAPRGVRLDLGGDLALSQALIDGIVRTQIGSLALSLLGVLVVAALVTRSFTAGLACAVPCAAAALATFGAMGVSGIPLGVATSMFAGIAIGVGDDYASLTPAVDRRQQIARGQASLQARAQLGRCK
jgi:predicted RND superfamily exporter protein